MKYFLTLVGLTMPLIAAVADSPQAPHPPAASFDVLSISDFTVSGSTATVSWDSNSGPFLLLESRDPRKGWVAAGAVLTGNTTVVEMSASNAFYRVVVATTVVYRVTFTATWSVDTHPYQFPPNAHFSGLVGTTHNGDVTFWQEGRLSTPGVQSVAETGNKTTFLNEISVASAAGSAENVLSGPNLPSSPTSTFLDFPVSSAFPQLTLISMVAPSPDWFLGVANLSLISSGEWVDGLVVPLYAYDTGTDSGASYASPNLATIPPAPLSKIQGFPALVDGTNTPFGTFTFDRLN